MSLTKVVNHDYHEATKHSFRSVQLNPNYVDASTQPALFKHYPKFFRRFSLDLTDLVHAFLHQTIAITFQKQYRQEWFARRVNPSAGALYPTELYVQLRGISGLLDGIYHLEAETKALTLIYELIDDGLEGYFSDNRKIHGFIFLVSCVYFRSSWKYQNRSLRYCFLDSGHQIGAIEAAAYGTDRQAQVQFDFDRLALNDDMGFENQEFATAAVFVGEPQIRTARRLRSPIPFVCGTDYFERNRFLEAGYQQSLLPINPTQPIAYPQFHFDQDRWLQAIWQRRSARRLFPEPIDQLDWQLIWQMLTQPIATSSQESMTIYAVVHAVTGLEPGIYRGDELIRSGLFRDQTGYLCINQAIARDSAVTLFFVSSCLNYQTALQAAGLLGQRVYLAATYLGLGCSGIGAFYDDETQAFLSTEFPVLYAMAIGADRTMNDER